MSLPYLEKELSYKVDVLDANKQESRLQVDSFIFLGLARYAQTTCVNLQYLCDILRKKVGIKLGT